MTLGTVTTVQIQSFYIFIVKMDARVAKVWPTFCDNEAAKFATRFVVCDLPGAHLGRCIGMHHPDAADERKEGALFWDLCSCLDVGQETDGSQRVVIRGGRGHASAWRAFVSWAQKRVETLDIEDNDVILRVSASTLVKAVCVRKARPGKPNELVLEVREGGNSRYVPLFQCLLPVGSTPGVHIPGYAAAALLQLFKESEKIKDVITVQQAEAMLSDAAAGAGASSAGAGDGTAGPRKSLPSRATSRSAEAAFGSNAIFVSQKDMQKAYILKLGAQYQYKTEILGTGPGRKRKRQGDDQGASGSSARHSTGGASARPSPTKSGIYGLLASQEGGDSLQAGSSQQGGADDEGDAYDEYGPDDDDEGPPGLVTPPIGADDDDDDDDDGPPGLVGDDEDWRAIAAEGAKHVAGHGAGAGAGAGASSPASGSASDIVIMSPPSAVPAHGGNGASGSQAAGSSSFAEVHQLRAQLAAERGRADAAEQRCKALERKLAAAEKIAKKGEADRKAISAELTAVKRTVAELQLTDSAAEKSLKETERQRDEARAALAALKAKLAVLVNS